MPSTRPAQLGSTLRTSSVETAREGRRGESAARQEGVRACMCVCVCVCMCGV